MKLVSKAACIRVQRQTAELQSQRGLVCQHCNQALYASSRYLPCNTKKMLMSKHCSRISNSVIAVVPVTIGVVGGSTCLLFPAGQRRRFMMQLQPN